MPPISHKGTKGEVVIIIRDIALEIHSRKTCPSACFFVYTLVVFSMIHSLLAMYQPLSYFHYLTDGISPREHL